MPISTRTIVQFGKPVLFIALALPALWVIGQWVAFAAGAPHGLGVNPQETSNRLTGLWALRSLMLTLALTPLAGAIGQNWPLAFRRMTGLFAFAYAALHLMSYFALDLVFDWQALAEDLIERPYIAFGMATLALLTPLALTSTRKAVRRLGAVRWKRLHRLVYLAAVFAAAHFLLLAKGDLPEAQVYALVILALLLARLVRMRRSAPARRGRVEKAFGG